MDSLDVVGRQFSKVGTQVVHRVLGDFLNIPSH